MQVVPKIVISNVGQPPLARSAMLATYYCVTIELACSFTSDAVASVTSVAQLLAQMAAISFYYV